MTFPSYTNKDNYLNQDSKNPDPDDLLIFAGKYGSEKGLQGWDLNPRPPGYEPDELPDCSTLRQGRNMVEEGLEPSRLC